MPMHRRLGADAVFLINYKITEALVANAQSRSESFGR